MCVPLALTVSRCGWQCPIKCGKKTRLGGLSSRAPRTFVDYSSYFTLSSNLPNLPLTNMEITTTKTPPISVRASTLIPAVPKQLGSASSSAPLMVRVCCAHDDTIDATDYYSLCHQTHRVQSSKVLRTYTCIIQRSPR